MGTETLTIRLDCCQPTRMSFFWAEPRNSSGCVLCWQVIKGTLITPAHHLSPLDRAEFFEAALLLEDLRQCFQLADAFRPFPFGTSEAVFEFGCQSLKVQIVLCEVVDGVVAFGLDPDVVQIGVDRASDVAGERPRGCGPDKEVFPGFR